MVTIKQWFRALGSILKKDFKSTKRVKKYLLPALIPTLGIFIVIYTATLAGSPDTYAVLLVNEDHGLPADSIISDIENASNEFYPYFNVIKVNSLADARGMLESYQYLALIDIPSGFSDNVTTGKVGKLQLVVQNVNSFTVDSFINRMDAVMNSFNQNYNVSGSGNNFALLMKPNYLVNQTMFDIRGFTIGAVTLSAILTGLFFGGMNIAKEYEDGTILEIMNSPMPRTAFIASKQILGVILGSSITGGIAIVLYLATGLQFLGNIFYVIIALLLTTLIHTSLGNLIGLRFKQTTPVLIIAILTSILMYFFTGGAAPLKMLGSTVQNISVFLPATYWNQILLSESLAPSAAYLNHQLLMLCVFAVAITSISWVVIQKRGFKS